MQIKERELLRILYFNADLLNNDHKNLYRKYKVNKKGKSGAQRTICEPIPELKELQRNLLLLLKRFPVSAHVTAYERGCSAQRNALLHLHSKHILHMDIKNFFPSINRRMFDDVFCKGLPLRTAEKLWHAVSYDNGLPIGAPTSPFIANRIMTEIDKKLSKVGFFIKYTRYADDMIFSSRFRLKNGLIDKIDKILHQAGFAVNRAKTYFMTNRREVTGLILHKNDVSVGTGYKKRLKSDLYNYLTHGTGRPDVIKGRLSYLADIEPHYIKVLKRKYKHLDIKNEFFKQKKIDRVSSS